MPVGRPAAIFDQELADMICTMTSASNNSLITILKEISKERDTVAITTVYKWLRENEEFAKDYARSKDDQADYLVEELLEIADDSSLDIAFTEDGKPFIDREHINRSRLRVDTRKWIVSKLKPKKYGDKVTQELTGSVEIHRIERVVVNPK